MLYFLKSFWNLDQIIKTPEFTIFYIFYSDIFKAVTALNSRYFNSTKPDNLFEIVFNAK